MENTAEQVTEQQQTEVNNAVLALAIEHERILAENKALQGQLARACEQIYKLQMGRDE